MDTVCQLSISPAGNYCHEIIDDNFFTIEVPLASTISTNSVALLHMSNAYFAACTTVAPGAIC